MKKILGGIILFFAVTVMTSCDAGKTVNDAIATINPAIKKVKAMTYKSGKTYEQIINGYMNDPEWITFDEKEHGTAVVEINGTSKDNKKIRIQFTGDAGAGSNLVEKQKFKLYYCSMDGVSYDPDDMMQSMYEYVFKDETGQEEKNAAKEDEQETDDYTEQDDSYEEDDYDYDEYDYEGDSDSGYIIPDSDSRYLTEEDLESLSQEQLRLARNEIYARHGYIFKDESLNQYFKSTIWYIPTTKASKFDESILNKYEKANAKFIKKYE